MHYSGLSAESFQSGIYIVDQQESESRNVEETSEGTKTNILWPPVVEPPCDANMVNRQSVSVDRQFGFGYYRACFSMKTGRLRLTGACKVPAPSPETTMRVTKPHFYKVNSGALQSNNSSTSLCTTEESALGGIPAPA
ncbi:hypothetical protein PGTUg99_013696 [Puccinia graminis f. sp. tritici]|uniref:Uncharacterized protein n=2 Tax=Puccinia graminis f. sp. tritici TaxID=56615 RepID=E3K1M7_PUCGT|nr:uncharacterized protein PGTG_04158 [Puccinia graminis f. sp. tritici CRL 75-36-700-3]EFP78202.1 hypothetical protein PGTG_04158 [Puccinia graminis f. sp. tritici CRL 75-36-700-3]KAA1135716.1 hypothetical protein PGTUg99_013696 [Puccinia graminis f. sp. tritici]